MLFVFGRRANQLRQKNVSELIHSSSALRNCQECEVVVHFADIVDHADDEGYDIVPNSRFTISRMADRQNKSEYRIDGKKAKFEEVATRLKDKGVDLDNNRFLILQGEVEQIAMMKPKAAQPGGENGLLEFLEEIIGTNEYIPGIEAAKIQLEELKEKQGFEQDRLTVAEKEKDAVMGGVAIAQRQFSANMRASIVVAQKNQVQRRSMMDNFRAKYDERAKVTYYSLIHQSSQLTVYLLTVSNTHCLSCHQLQCNCFILLCSCYSLLFLCPLIYV